MMREYISLLDRLKSWALYPLPQHAISRDVYWLTQRRGGWVPLAIRAFVRLFDVQLEEAVVTRAQDYETFNAFFTRALKPGARPLAPGEHTISSPADGRISAVGPIERGQLLQAKGQHYQVSSLLGGDADAARTFENGRFITIYLSPGDYHRLHMPLAGTLQHQTHVAGRLYSVAPHTVRAIGQLFTRNERVAAQFDTTIGPMSLVLVGAINVAAIETVWDGLITPPAGLGVQRRDYRPGLIHLQRGQEMGRFNLGSTVIVLLPPGAEWLDSLQPGDAVRLGQALGTLTPAAPGSD